MENNNENKIVNYLFKCGVRPHLKGFRYLYKAIKIIIENDGVMPKITKCIYPEVAREYRDTPSRVERACRNAIQTAKPEYKFLSVGEFIAGAAVRVACGK